MKKSSIILSALILALGLAALGLFVKSGIDNVAYNGREVTVRGLAEREVKANMVTWPLEYSVAGNDLLSLYDQVKRNNASIVKFLTSNGLSADEIAVNPPDLYNASTNQYTSSYNYAYSLSCTITVRSTKVDTVRALLDRQAELLREGIPCSSQYIRYEYTALNDIKPEMIAEATKNAREAAAKFAQDSGSKIGKMKTAYQGQFSIEEGAVPYIKNVRVVSTIVYYLED